MKTTIELTNSEREQISTILTRRANEIASYKEGHKKDSSFPASVDYALELEVKRLRNLSDKVKVPEVEDEEE